jgi:hypothetical protein
MTTETFERLLNEFKDLNEKVSKLRSFILEDHKDIDNLNRDLLIAQLKAMEAYISILSIRIGLNAPKDDNVTDAEVIESEQENNIH